MCEFGSASEAQGCLAVLSGDLVTNTTIIRKLSASKTREASEAFDCFSGLPAGNYTVTIREIECTGGIGVREFVHYHVNVTGVDNLSLEGT